MGAFQLTLPGFEGPVADLPTLVSARQLALDELPLADIPVQFLEDARRREEINLEEAGELLAAVARLMFLKSVHLLADPYAEDSDELDAQPVRSREHLEIARQAAQALAASGTGETYSSSGREQLIERIKEPRSTGMLVDAWNALRSRERGQLIRTSVPVFVRLEVAISRIIGSLKARQRLSFRALVRGSSRREVVMHFLATLELIRRGQVRAEQDGLFSDITLGSEDAADGRQSRAG